MTHQSQPIEKLKANLNIFYELVLGFSNSSQIWFPFQRFLLVSVRYVKVTKDGTVKKMHEDMANENESLELNFKEDIHQ